MICGICYGKDQGNIAFLKGTEQNQSFSCFNAYRREKWMKTYRRELWFEVPARRAFINITPEVEECLRESKVKEGLVLVKGKHMYLLLR